MKDKQVSFFWNVIWHMEKERMFFPKYQQNSRGFAVYCMGKKYLSVDLNLPVVLQNLSPNLHGLFRNAEVWNWSWFSLTRCEGASRFSLIYLPLTSLSLVLCPILASQHFEMVECSYDEVQISLQHIYLCTWSSLVHTEHREGGRSKGKHLGLQSLLLLFFSNVGRWLHPVLSAPVVLWQCHTEDWVYFSQPSFL